MNLGHSKRASTSAVFITYFRGRSTPWQMMLWTEEPKFSINSTEATIKLRAKWRATSKCSYPEPQHVSLCARSASCSTVSLTFPSMWHLNFVQSIVFLLGPHTQGGPRTFESQPVLIMTRPVLTAQCPPPHADSHKQRHTHTHNAHIG